MRAVFEPGGPASTWTLNYAPINLLALAVEWQLFGLAPRGYHVVNVWLHLGVTALVVLFLARTGLGRAGAALGGLDSLWGAIVGGLAIGAVQSILVPYTPIPNELSLLAAVVVLMLVLLFKPSGLFGTPQVERV